MQYLTLGDKLQVPLALVSGLSWTKAARTVERRGGYIVAIGLEGVEVSVHVGFTYAAAEALGVDVAALYVQLTQLATDCLDKPARLMIGDWQPVPSLLFAVTSINRTQNYDPAFDPTCELDIIFTGVKVAKDAARNAALSEGASGELPRTSIKRGATEIAMCEDYTLAGLVERGDSVEMTVEIRDDMSVPDRKAFTEKLVDGKTRLVISGKEYTIVDTQLDGTSFTVTASMWPIAAQKPLTKTYRDTTLKAILTDLAKTADIELKCKIDGAVDYYLQSGTPQEGILALARSAGALAVWRDGVLRVVDVPTSIPDTDFELEADTEIQAAESEDLTSMSWTDGIKSAVAGDASGAGSSVTSVYRGQEKSTECLRLARFASHTLQARSPIVEGIQIGSVVRARVSKDTIPALVIDFEHDLLTGQATYILAYI